MIFHSGNRMLWDCNFKPAGSIDDAVHIVARLIVACCFLPAIVVVWLIIMAVFAGLISGAKAGLHHP